MKYLLITTTTCPKCPATKQYVREHIKLPGQMIDETHPGFNDTIQKHNATLAPTFILLNEHDEEQGRAHDPESIQTLINKKT